MIYMCIETYLWLVKGEIRSGDGLQPPKAPRKLENHTGAKVRLLKWRLYSISEGLAQGH